MDDARALSCFSVGSVAGAYDEIYLPRIFIPWARLLLERAAFDRAKPFSTSRRVPEVSPESRPSKSVREVGS